MQGRSEKNKARETNESTSVWWPVWEVLKICWWINQSLVQQIKCRNTLCLCGLFFEWSVGYCHPMGAGKWILFWLTTPQNHLLSWSLVFVSSSVLSIKTDISAGWEPLISEGYGSICKSKQAVPLLVHLLRDFIYPEDFMSLPSEFM